MIHVSPQPEPDSFDKQVRQKGLAWLDRKQIPLDKPVASNTELSPYWRKCLDDLYGRYGGFCAYLAVHFERATGGGSVDHFIAKSKRADLAYEWSNYRLACSTMNSRKRDYEDVLDPFEVETGWFCLELVSGRIYPSQDLPGEISERVQATIDRLGLDDPVNRELRARLFDNYWQKGYPEDYLRSYSPFVWFEAKRQGVL